MTECNYEFTQYLKTILTKKRDRKYLLKYMAEMCEASYRRGVQQAFTMPEHMRLKMFDDDDKIAKWRFGKGHMSRGLDGYTTTSKERFLIENAEWSYLDD